jgi:ribonuclease BN (tRNA processing enzyme)
VEHDNNLGVRTIYDEDGLVIKTIGVPHGPAPSLAFRIEYQGKSVAYSGDPTSLSPNGNMIEISRDADLLIYDTAILDETGAPFSLLHTTPGRRRLKIATDERQRPAVCLPGVCSRAAESS